MRDAASVVRLLAQTALGSPFGVANLVKEFRAEDVSLRERADIGAVLVTAAVDGAGVSSAIGDTARIELPPVPGMIAKGGDRTVLWLSPRSWLIQCPVAEEVALVGAINDAFPDKLVHAVRFGDALCWLELTGSGARELLTEGGFLSLERDGLAAGRAKRTLIAQIAVVLVHESESVWLVGVERSRVRYFVQWLSSAAA
jgi:heterotetrameric sarcosine oxidase gamma subunit